MDRIILPLVKLRSLVSDIKTSVEIQHKKKLVQIV